MRLTPCRDLLVGANQSVAPCDRRQYKFWGGPTQWADIEDHSHKSQVKWQESGVIPFVLNNRCPTTRHSFLINLIFISINPLFFLTKHSHSLRTLIASTRLFAAEKQQKSSRQLIRLTLYQHAILSTRQCWHPRDGNLLSQPGILMQIPLLTASTSSKPNLKNSTGPARASTPLVLAKSAWASAMTEKTSTPLLLPC